MKSITRVKPITRASAALLLDIMAFIAASVLAMKTSNIALIIFYAVLLYIIAYDTFQATVYITRHFKNK